MIEKVNPKHPDKIADRIAGAIVDLAYMKCGKPKIAVEVLIGHNQCNIIVESNIFFDYDEVRQIVYRIAGNVYVDLKCVAQDEHLAGNQAKQIRCGLITISSQPKLLNALLYTSYATSVSILL